MAIILAMRVIPDLAIDAMKIKFSLEQRFGASWRNFDFDGKWGDCS
jgi:hypothetical protein